MSLQIEYILNGQREVTINKRYAIINIENLYDPNRNHIIKQNSIINGVIIIIMDKFGRCKVDLFNLNIQTLEILYSLQENIYELNLHASINYTGNDDDVIIKVPSLCDHLCVKYKSIQNIFTDSYHFGNKLFNIIKNMKNLTNFIVHDYVPNNNDYKILYDALAYTKLNSLMLFAKNYNDTDMIIDLPYLKDLSMIFDGNEKDFIKILKFNNNQINSINLIVSDPNKSMYLLANLINISKCKHVLKEIDVHNASVYNNKEFMKMRMIASDIQGSTFPHEAFRQKFNVEKLGDCRIMQ